MREISGPENRVPPVRQEGISSPGPVLLADSYKVDNQQFRELLEWRIPPGARGRLHQLKLVSSNDSVTRWRISLNGREMPLPSDRTTLITPASYSFYGGPVDGQAVSISVRSTDGTAITATAVIIGEIG